MAIRRTVALSIIFACQLSLCACSDFCVSESCEADQLSSTAHSNLMQLRFTQGKDNVDVEDESCRSEIGKQSPLTEAGFKSVAESCCFDDMKDFIRRAVEGFSLQVCDEGGLSGIAPFFSCPSEPRSFFDLQNELTNATEASGNKRHWLAEVGSSCTGPDPSCGITSANPTSRPTLFKGYVGLQASNPSELVTNPAVKDAIQSKLADAIRVPEAAIMVKMGSGPVGGTSLLQKVASLSCDVFASYAVVQTDPPTLDMSQVAISVAALDPKQLQRQALRSQTTTSLDSWAQPLTETAEDSSRVFAAVAPVPPQHKDCCVLQ